MYRRVIPLQVADEYVRGDGVPVGAAGSHDDVALRLAFGPMWAGTARSIVWYDANGATPTITALTTDMLEEGESEVYLVPIPAAPKAQAGQLLMTIKGATVSGDRETTATLTTTARFTVMESDWSEDAEEGGDITPTQAEQFQAEIENIKAGIIAAKAAGAAAAESEANAKASEEAAAASANAAAASEAAAAGSASSAAGSASSAAASKAAAETARSGAQSAQGAAETAQEAAQAAQGAAEAAQSAAAQSAQEAAASAASAAQSAQEAAQSEAEAQGHADGAAGSAATAEACKAAAQASQKAAEESAETAESWAVGGTGTREGENTNNAKYWAQQAEATVGGDFATKTEAQGYVADHNQSATAHSDIREAVSEAGKAFVITGTFAVDAENYSVTVSGITATLDEVKTALAAEKIIVLKLAEADGDGTYFCMYPTEQSVPDDGPLFLSFESPYGIWGYGEVLHIAVFVIFEASGVNTSAFMYPEPQPYSEEPSSPGIEASPGESTQYARGDHVHPKEVSDIDRASWNAKAEKPAAVSVTLTSAEWDSTTKTQAVTAAGVTADNIVIVAPYPDNQDAYAKAGVKCTVQGENSLTFTCKSVPTEGLIVNVVIMNG